MKYEPLNDLMVKAVPTPKTIDPTHHSMLVLRVRAKNYISSAAVHVSLDGKSYLQVYDSLGHVVGGRLLQPILGHEGTIEEGPTIKVIGPDVGTLRVLSDEDWKIGRQPMLIDDEWCFVRQLTAVGDDRYQIRGILRGQMGSPIRDHAHGAEIFLADARVFQPIRDPAVRLGRTIWIKTQPVASQALPLTEALAWQFELPEPAATRTGREEAPTWVSDTKYLLSEAPMPGTLKVFLNGLLLRPGSKGSYRLEGQKITLLETPAGGSWLLCWYDPLVD